MIFTLIIQSAQIASGSLRTYRQSQTRQESVTLWNNSTESSVTYFARDTESISEMEQHGELNQESASGIVAKGQVENTEGTAEESVISASMREYLN